MQLWKSSGNEFHALATTTEMRFHSSSCSIHLSFRVCAYSVLHSATEKLRTLRDHHSQYFINVKCLCKLYTYIDDTCVAYVLDLLSYYRFAVWFLVAHVSSSSDAAAYKTATIALAVIAGIAIVIIISLVVYIVKNGLYFASTVCSRSSTYFLL